MEEPIDEARVEVGKSRTRIAPQEAFNKGVVILRDCGGLSFYLIALLLKGDRTSERNIKRTYEIHRWEFMCQKGEEFVHAEEENARLNQNK